MASRSHFYLNGPSLWCGVSSSGIANLSPASIDLGLNVRDLGTSTEILSLASVDPGQGNGESSNDIEVFGLATSTIVLKPTSMDFAPTSLDLGLALMDAGKSSLSL